MRYAKITKRPTLDFNGRESLNTICSNLTFSGKNIRKLVLTSCVASEGKSTMSARIAFNMAARGKSVVLVDCDLRRSFTIRSLGMKAEGKKYGVAHYLAGLCQLDDALYETDVPGFYIMPAGRDVTNPLPLINGPEFDELLSGLAEAYDFVIVDAPPIGLVIDAAEIAKYCDGIVMVVEYGKRHKRELINAVRQMKRSNCPILGCIIDKVTVKTLSDKQYYRSHYYSGYGYGNEGYYARREKSGEDE